ncbi:hypothetical protein [Wolbachia endosymbiont of Litomosoides sigmodontis]|nr:hypothetical protein [Wolbachia endosymbiont of Litomosoides sigmodontis]
MPIVVLKELIKKFLLVVMVIDNNMEEVKEKVDGEVKTEPLLLQ